MKHLSRYTLVGLLIGSLVVDTAAAGRLFRRSRCECPPVCCEVCPAPSCSDPCSVVLEESCNSCHENTATEVSDSACQDCESTVVTEPVPAAEELTVPPPTPLEADAEDNFDEEMAEKAEKTAEEAPADKEPKVIGNPDIGPPIPLAEPEVAPRTIIVPPSAEETPAEPSVEGEQEEPESEYGDLFDEPSSPETTPSESETEPADEEKPATDDELDGLFGDAAEGGKEEVVAEVQPPAPKADAEESAAKANDDFADALFGTEDELPVSEESEEEDAAPVVPQESTPTEPEEAYDIFDTEARESILESTGGLQSELARVWTDSTGAFECQARLIKVSTSSVVLQRISGQKLVVKLSRLGNSDLEFVRQQVIALRVAQARDAAAEKLAVAWAK